MGCDIHLYVEKKVYGYGGKEQNKNKKGIWILADKLEVDVSNILYPNDGYFDYRIVNCYTNRQYALFGILAGVRREELQVFDLKGVPSDSCREIRLRDLRWGVDGHSHSHINLKELKEEFLKEKTIKISGMKDKEEYEKLKKSIDKGKPNWNLLYPYCGSTTIKTHIEFSVEVPYSFLFKNFIEKVINYMDKIKEESYYGLKEEDLRIVFWFDN